MPQQGFGATVSNWVREVKARELAVCRESTQRVLDLAQTPTSAGGRMRVDTGFLRASLVLTLGHPGFAVTFNPGGPAKVTYNEAATSLVILSAKINDTISAVWTANYAIHREFGANGQPPDAFVRMAAQQWAQIVAQVVADLKAKRGG